MKTIPITLSKTTKMPCHSFSIPAQACKTGSVLAKREGTVCSGCYALRGFYRMRNVKETLQRRLESIDDPQWVTWMVDLIREKEKSGYFRWHDSGDLQSEEHLRKIIAVAQLLPDIRFWLPTREKEIVRSVLRLSVCPRNLTIRVSGALVDGPRPAGFRNTSTVVSSGWTCPADDQGHQCKDCRRCWDKRVGNISYRAY